MPAIGFAPFALLNDARVVSVAARARQGKAAVKPNHNASWEHDLFFDCIISLSFWHLPMGMDRVCNLMWSDARALRQQIAMCRSELELRFKRKQDVEDGD